MHNFRDLKIWQRSVEFSVRVYSVTREFPEAEKYGLISQIRRCSVSISSNIAEGAGRRSNKDFLNFLSIARGSAFELETQLIISEKLKFINKEDFESLCDELIEIQNMLFGFMKKLDNSLEVFSSN